MITAQKMYVDWSFCSCSSCVILLLLQWQNKTVTTTTIKRSLYIHVLINSRTHIYWITVLILLHCNILLTLEVHTILGHQMPLLGVHLTVICLLNCIPQHVKMTLCSTALDHQMPLLGVHLTAHCLLSSIPQHVKMTSCSTALGHQMPLLVGYIWPEYVWLYMSSWPYIWLSGSSWPDVVLLLATRCL